MFKSQIFSWITLSKDALNWSTVTVKTSTTSRISKNAVYSSNNPENKSKKCSITYFWRIVWWKFSSATISRYIKRNVPLNLNNIWTRFFPSQFGVRRLVVWFSILAHFFLAVVFGLWREEWTEFTSSCQVTLCLLDSQLFIHSPNPHIFLHLKNRRSPSR